MWPLQLQVSPEHTTEQRMSHRPEVSGAIFCYKDNKKGQQDTLQFFFESVIGYMVTFQTQTTHVTSCTVMLPPFLCCTSRLLFIKFLELVQDKKKSGKFTNIKSNVYHALQDTPTVTELCILILYAQSISHPYM